MNHSGSFAGVCLAAMAVLLPMTAHAGWSRVETITIQGRANGIRGGSVIHRNYGGGVYRFSLDPNSPGISYNPGAGFPKTISAFVTVVDQTPGGAGGMSYGLIEIGGPVSVINANDDPVGVDYFIEDWNIYDNQGSVNVFVDVWK